MATDPNAPRIQGGEAMTSIREIERHRMDRIADQIREEIEALVEGPSMLSETAYTPRRTRHTVIANGQIKTEGEPPVPRASPLEMAWESVRTAARLRSAIKGDAVLVWRCKPMFERESEGYGPGEYGLYLRLCFEPL